MLRYSHKLKMYNTLYKAFRAPHTASHRLSYHSSDAKPRWQWGNKYTALCRKVDIICVLIKYILKVLSAR